MKIFGYPLLFKSMRFVTQSYLDLGLIIIVSNVTPLGSLLTIESKIGIMFFNGTFYNSFRLNISFSIN